MSIAGPEKEVGGKRDTTQLSISPALGLSVFVVFTSTTRTLKALGRAAEIARPFGVGIVILAMQVVPFLLSLDQLPVPFDFIIRRFRKVASRSPWKIRVRAYVCRDQFETLKRILPPNSPIVIGVRKGWWPTHDEKLARRLRRAGHDVTLLKTE